MNSPSFSGVVVKLVITSACHAEERGFKSRSSRHFITTYAGSSLPHSSSVEGQQQKGVCLRPVRRGFESRNRNALNAIRNG